VAFYCPAARAAHAPEFNCGSEGEAMTVRVFGWLTFIVVVAAAGATGGCYRLRGSVGGGQIAAPAQRTVRPADVALPPGYSIEPVAMGLTFPTGVVFDDRNTPYVIESGYSYGEAITTPRLLRVESGGATTAIASGSRNGPWNGGSFANGAFYVAEGGEMEGGRILRITPEGNVTAIVENLPSMGDHHTNGAIVGPDGNVYFGQGTATNAGVVGEDNFMFGWLKRKPDFHDTPCQDITVSGVNFPSNNPLQPGQKVMTGAFSAFGTTTTKGQMIRGRVPCNGAVMRVPPNGGSVQLVAWGFRNPFGLAFSPEGRLFVTDNGYDDRGSRAVWGTGDLLWEIKEGTWYGWPDYSGDLRLTESEFSPPGKRELPPVIANPPNRPPKPVATFAVHSSSDGFDFSSSDAFGYVGQAFVAQFGDQAPTTGKVLAPVGFKIVRVDVATGVMEDFATNIGRANGPASRLKTGGLERPVAARFTRDGTALYIVDFGILLESEDGTSPRQGTGVLWRVTRSGGR
jgi:glucose/arabinose dehydrogenase